MELTPNSELLQRLFRKQELLERGDDRHREIRPWLFFLGGGWGGGVITGAAALALHRLGLVECFDAIIGESSGAGTAAYFLAGEERTRIGITIFTDECTSRRFFNPFHRPMVNIDFIEWVLRESPKRLDVAAVLASRPELFIMMRDATDGSLQFINAKSARPDLPAAIKAAVALPGWFYGRPVPVNGQRMLDAGARLSIREAYQALKHHPAPTDILVIETASRQVMARWSLPYWERLGAPVLYRKHPKGVRRAILGRISYYRESWAFLRSLRDVNIGVLWAPCDVRPFERNQQKLRSAGEFAAHETMTLLAATEAKFWKRMADSQPP